jgi:hypothetical protein
MKSNEEGSPKKDSTPWWKRINLEFYYVEKVGSRYHLRVTPFFWIIIIFTLLFFFGAVLTEKYREQGKLNSNSSIQTTPSPLKVSSTPIQLTPNRSTNTVQNRR